MIYCKKCGTQLDDDARFCTKCGNPVEDAADGMTTPPAAAKTLQTDAPVTPPAQAAAPVAYVPSAPVSPAAAPASVAPPQAVPVAYAPSVAQATQMPPAPPTENAKGGSVIAGTLILLIALALVVVSLFIDKKDSLCSLLHIVGLVLLLLSAIVQGKRSRRDVFALNLIGDIGVVGLGVACQVLGIFNASALLIFGALALVITLVKTARHAGQN